MNKRKIIIALSLFVIQFTTYGQSGLPLNSSGKIEISEVVKIDSVKKVDLFQRMAVWINDIASVDLQVTVVEKDSINGKMKCQLQFMVYSQTGVLKKVQGAVSYSLTCEVKDDKYRYVFTDFIYHYYGQNRNYQVVETGKKKLLEEPKATGWQKGWDHTKSVTRSKIVNQINSMKIAMETKKPAPVLTTTETKKTDW
jgi:hypothetical protein